MGRRGEILGGALIVLGFSAMAFGVMTGNEASYYVVVEGTVAEDSLSDEHDVIEYDYLEPHVQDGFREAIETGDSVEIPQPPEDIWGGYVHYRGSYYFSSIEVAGPSQHTMAFSIGAGVVLLLLGGGIVLRSARAERDGPEIEN